MNPNEARLRRQLAALREARDAYARGVDGPIKRVMLDTIDADIASTLNALQSYDDMRRMLGAPLAATLEA